MKIERIMSRPVITVGEESTLEEVARIMLQNRIACLPVVNADSVVVGIVTEASFTAKEKWVPFTRLSLPQLFGNYLGAGQVDSFYEAARKITAREVMDAGVTTVTEDALVREVLEKMLSREVNHVLVVRDGVPVGIVARHDLLKMLLEQEPKDLSS